MGRFAHRITMPLLAGIGLLAGSTAFAQRFNPDDDIDYMRVPKITSTLKPDSTYGVIFTHLHGPETPTPAMQVVNGIRHVLEVEEIFNTPSKDVGYHGLGNALDSVGPSEIGAHFRTLAQSHTDQHNIMICFHGSAFIDSTHFNNNAVVIGQGLRNDSKAPSEKTLYDAHLIGAINRNSFYTGARYDILWIPCQGGSAARVMGAFPNNSTILVESDAFHDTHDYQQSFMAAFKKGKSWKPVDAHYFLEARLFFQNSMVSADPAEWNENLLVFYTSDDTAERAPAVAGKDTLNFARRRANVLDFNHMAARVTTDFTKQQLETSAAQFTDIVEAGALLRANMIADERDANPGFQPAKNGYFDFSLPEKTIAKLSRVHSADDFQTKLSDPERKFARIIMIDLYRTKKDLLETAEDYVQRVNIIPLAPVMPK